MAGFPKGAKAEKAKRPMPGIPLDKEKVKELLAKNRGNVSRVADIMGCNRHTIHNMLNTDEDVKQICIQARERYLDELEDSVFDRAIESNDTTLQIFVLKTQGRKRGWDQDPNQNQAHDIAKAAFDYVLNRSKNPAE